MHYSKLRISTEATSRLRSLRQRTGVTPNLLCRAAIMLSLEEGPVTSLAPDEKGLEFNAYTLTGEHTGTIGALLRFVEEDDGGPELSDPVLIERLRAHIHRGIGTLAVRAKSPADLGRLAMRI
ncbi:DNA sulfur modification protein DndE [Sphingosinicella terrae]|uniref:DNA sulfur modification protein DndE n=1 Tax=Sphingosinicella terrae TaxID=2172047 RepID=UPI000E0D522D|nr:DNA sulfur modification protein DndE [Sphingosinicella terrae]